MCHLQIARHAHLPMTGRARCLLMSMQRSEIDLHLVLQAARNRPIAVLMYRIHKLFRYLAEVQETLPYGTYFFLVCNHSEVMRLTETLRAYALPTPVAEA